MQFLENSIIGLRAARHVLTHPDRAETITLFPMVHLGEAAFYDGVFADAAQNDAVLIEGVSSPISKRLTASYRWAATRRLGLIVQPKFISQATRVIHADLPGAEFDALWRAGSRRERMVFEAACLGLGLWLRLMATRENLARGLSTDDLTDRDDILVWNRGRAPLLHALKAARDAVLCRSLTDLLSEPQSPRTIAVIYGAGHMPALVRALDAEGFQVTQSEWLTVFES
ncbi:MAG: hypothetical protein AAFO72_06420 [Pseudomonadota bacterium]